MNHNSNQGNECPRFIFLGRWQLGASALKRLVEIGKVVAVVSSAEERDEPYANAVWRLAGEFGIPHIDFQTKKWRKKLREFSCDLLVSCAFSRFLERKDLSIAGRGAVNLHPSLLPKYRGPAPIQAAILAGDDEIGMTAHWMDEEVDHGPILAQTKWPLLADDTPEGIVEKMALGIPVLAKMAIDLALAGEEGRSQNHSEATFAPRITIPWNLSVSAIRERAINAHV